MDYATPDIRAAVPAPRQKAKAAAQKSGAVPAVGKTKERQRRNAVRPPALSPCGAAAYGFLKIRFLPQLPAQQAGCEREKQAFYQSFAVLCSYYGITPVPTESLPYPYGREVALYEAHRLLKAQHLLYVSVDFEREKGDSFALKATEGYNTNSTLYYIPVAPLHYLLNQRRRKGEARLLLCIFAYLYHIAGVPCYGDEGTYLYGQYDMLRECNDEDEEKPDCLDGYTAEINAAFHIGEVIARRLWNPIHLDNFGEWLERFMPRDGFARQCAELARRAYALWQEYPDVHIYSHADTECLPEDEDDDEDNDCITMEKYIGFVASTDGELYERLEQDINSEFNEYQYLQEPVVRKCFGAGVPQDDSLDFECRLFPLIDDLCYLLNNLDYET